MRFAISIPRSKVTPGRVRARANATPSKVLWSSFFTITSHGRPAPEPGPDWRGFCFRTGGATVLMRVEIGVVDVVADDGWHRCRCSRAMPPPRPVASWPRVYRAQHQGLTPLLREP